MFATTLALAARHFGFASKVVNGYYGGDWNEPGGFLLIRNRHAHSWVEVWQNGRWRRLDPTPAARWLQPPGMHFIALDALWESVKMSWYRYVLAFEASDRAQLALSLWRSLLDAAPWLGAAALLLWLALRIWQLTGRIGAPGLFAGRCRLSGRRR